MGSRLGYSALMVFSVWDDALDFLADIFESSTTPNEEIQMVLDKSLTGGSEDWRYLIDCARSMHSCHVHRPQQLDGADVLTYVWQILEKNSSSEPLDKPWGKTDRLISVARGLAHDPKILPPVCLVNRDGSGAVSRINRVAKNKLSTTTSPFWSSGGSIMANKPPFANNSLQLRRLFSKRPRVSLAPCPSRKARSQSSCSQIAPACNLGFQEQAIKRVKSELSPFFSSAAPPTKSPATRPPPGTVSCIKFPSLTTPSFGLIQERLAHEPFWLLIAITFLIRTTGALAIPVFENVRERFPTPEHLADPANAEELLQMIQHLGLSTIRVAYIQKYAITFLETPPHAGVYYRVKNYDRRDINPSEQYLQDYSIASASGLLTPKRDDEDELEAWEIGHMTKGKYAIDSWRIFCRDELLGRAEDWNGQGREGEFQPEWMRVMPHDKELRAYLRWMWMREGWEWDPVTGNRTILRDELRRAVEEGRVEYDNTGGLRILYE